MRVVTAITEGENKALEDLVGKNVTFFCANYIYTGKLTEVSDVQAKLENAKIVYETGSFDDPNWSEAQNIPSGGTWYIRLSAVESYGIMK